MNNPVSLEYASAQVAKKKLIPDYLIHRVSTFVDYDIIKMVRTDNCKLLKDLHHSKKISKEDSKVLIDWIVEFGSISMMKLAIYLGYQVFPETIARAVEIGDFKKTKILFSYLNPKDLIDDYEIAQAFNVAVEDESEDIVKFLCRFEMNTKFMSLEAEKRYRRGVV